MQGPLPPAGSRERAGPAPPALAFDGASLSLAVLLARARAHQVDLARLSLPLLAERIATAMAAAAPLAQKADWVTMAAWLLKLRSDLLTPGAASPDPAASDHSFWRSGQAPAAGPAARALAGWLAGRHRLGHDVFARGQPEPGLALDAEPAVDVVEFLWASLALFDVAGAAAAPYRPSPPDLHAVAEARARILRLLADAGAALPLARLLPAPEGAGLKRRSAWSSTFAASLELARQGAVVLAQQDGFAEITVAAPRLNQAALASSPPQP
jgi:segregation and condensation protein A